MNALLRRLVRRIQAEGPIPVADYMAECLLNPRQGYYTSEKEPFGVRGDFVTAPEISQMFGEMIGLWCVDAWQRAMGAPAKFHLIELGPGRGTLMADALRAARAAPDFLRAAEIHLVEASPALRGRQRQRLSAQAPTWHGGFETTPEGPFLLVANEFFDALPVRQLVRGERGFHERLVGLAPGGEALAFGMAGEVSAHARLLPPPLVDAPRGSIVEVSPPSLSLVRAIAGRIARHGGAALIVDYGPAASAPGATLQALRRHARHDPLADPGEADLTAHVDFAALAKAARDEGIAAFGPVPQGEFLRALGIDARARRLSESASEEQRTAITSALDRLLGEAEMGTLFKALALGSGGAPVPAGFAGSER